MVLSIRRDSSALLAAWRSSLAALVMGALSACGAESVEEPADTSSEALRSTGLALTYDVLADTDVGGFTFTATEVDCGTGLPVAPPNIVTAFEDLEDVFLPGTGGMFEDAPFDGASQHLFSDHFFALAPGCYDVTIQPVTDTGEPSGDCAPATAFNVPVIDGQTTEILLISQCRERNTTGGLDVIAAINHPPRITGLTYDPSKFICEDTTTICVTAEDPDSDPVTIVPTGGTGWTLLSQFEDPTTGESCFEFQFTGPGDYEVTFTAYDMGYDASGVLVPMTDILLAQGTTIPSEDHLTVPVHVLPEDDCITTCECPEGFELTPAGDECIRIEEAELIVNPITYQVCKAGASSAYGWGGAQYPGGLIDNALTFFTQRLNTVGVWACNAEETGAGTAPVNEWIGFSVCLDIEEAGDYMVGIAGDNRVRFRLNGAPTFTLDSPLTANFNYWWMNPIALGSGLNIVELEGRNDGSIAAFGAEIYGPFPSASLTTDASMAALNYPDNIVWSTLDVIGEPFLTGEASGVSCPDGFSLNTCEGELSCTQVLRVPCLDVE